jgi:hypothetical protein
MYIIYNTSEILFVVHLKCLDTYTTLWVVTPCSLVQSWRNLLPRAALKIQRVGFSKWFISKSQTV